MANQPRYRFNGGHTAGRNREPNRIPPDGAARDRLAYYILIFAVLVLAGSVVASIWAKPDNAILIVNIILPVVSSWVGTILAFYFGKENFEVANQQVRELVRRLTPEESANVLATSIMRRLTDIVYVKTSQEQDITIEQLRNYFKGNVSRLPILDMGGKPKYMIHESSVDKYLASKSGKEEDSLAEFIDQKRKIGVEFSLGKGFVIVSEETTVAAAKRKIEESSSCQDIFITRRGNPDEPLIGWISNVRMVKFLEV